MGRDQNGRPLENKGKVHDFRDFRGTSKIDPNLVQKLARNWPKAGQNWPKAGQKLARSWPKAGQKWIKSWPEMDQKVIKRSTKMAPKWDQKQEFHAPACVCASLNFCGCSTGLGGVGVVVRRCAFLCEIRCCSSVFLCGFCWFLVGNSLWGSCQDWFLCRCLCPGCELGFGEKFGSSRFECSS